MDAHTAFYELKKLHEEAEKDNDECMILLIAIWKETKDKRIEELFRQRSGVMIDGEYLFSE